MITNAQYREIQRLQYLCDKCAVRIEELDLQLCRERDICKEYAKKIKEILEEVR